MKLHWHKWSNWGEPTEYNYVSFTVLGERKSRLGEAQRRTCTKCGMVQERNIK